MKTLLIQLDRASVRALGAYGNEWVATPTIDALAATGVVFERHYACRPDPDKGRLELHCGGTDPIDRSGQPQSYFSGARTDILGGLASSNVPTLLFDATRRQVAHPYYARFVRRFACPPRPGDKTPLDALLGALPGALFEFAESDMAFAAVELDSLTPPWDIPAEVFAEYIEGLVTPGEAVEPWSDPPTGFFDRDDEASWQLLHRSFAAAMTTFDADLARILKVFDETWGEYCVVLTALAGMPLGEHGVVGPHRAWLYSELTHLPLIVRLPGGEFAGRRVPALTTTADLMGTIWGLCEPNDSWGLVPLLADEHAWGRDHLITGLHLTSPASGEWAVRTRDWLYVSPGVVPEGDDPRTPELYVQPEDRYEVNNVIGQHAEVAERLEAILAAGVGPPAKSPQ